MKKVKINYIGFWPDFDKTDNFFQRILAEKFIVEVSDDPDFVFVSPLGETYEYLKYNCVRILYTGEPLTPDFNVFDYAIGFDKINILDKNMCNRYYRFPFCFYSKNGVKKPPKALSFSEAKAELQKKKYFCNFIYGHKSFEGDRERILKIIQDYKRVESAGSFMNNMPDGKIIPFTEEKKKFLRLCKFTIACESVSFPGFVTEKLMDPFYSCSVPIYFGNPFVAEEFNTNAFINRHNYSSDEDFLKQIIKVDMDDDCYIKMLMSSKMKNENYLDDLYLGIKEFLWYIFRQDREEAFRRLRYAKPMENIKFIDEHRKTSKTFLGKLCKKINN